MNLSAHFTLEELVRSEYCERNGIDNTPPPEAMENLKRLAYALDEARAVLGRPIIIGSGYRCERLERELTKIDFAAWCARRDWAPTEDRWQLYFAGKKHPQGLAADLESPDFGHPIQIATAIAESGIVFDQLIYEHSWVHFGLAGEGEKARRQILTQVAGGGYADGIHMRDGPVFA